jgi:hypothetical protein
LVEHVRAIDIEDPTSKRKAQLRRLEELALPSEKLRDVQELCVRAHQALLSAEQRHEGAEKALAKAEQRAAEGDKPDETETARIAGTVQQSRQALAKARELLPQCQQKTAKLAADLSGRR